MHVPYGNSSNSDGNWKQCSITYTSFCGCFIYTAFEKQEKLIDRIIHGAEQIKHNIIPMCEIHSFNRSKVQLWAMLTFRTDRGGELHVNILHLCMNTETSPLVSVNQQHCREILCLFKGNMHWNQMDNGESDSPYVWADSKNAPSKALSSRGVDSVKGSQYCPPCADQIEWFNELKQRFLKSSDAQLHFNPDYAETLILSKYCFFKTNMFYFEYVMC